MNENEESQRRLAEVVRLLKEMPIVSASSAKEPLVEFRMIDFTQAIAVAVGETNPADWVSVSCPNTESFEHSPHHWNEYREGQTPLRVPHYCDGIFAEGVSA
ncbi:hypothetical protein [Herbiconiux sp. YIM B11900]|uniref:hypothetical protein n=1 Tax=Herbiconiux sp. YIM B11900 TaxID=3404131 RepID=UPI003F84B274